MAIIGQTDAVPGFLVVLVDHDPMAVATDVSTGSMIIEQSTGKHFRKIDDGATTNVGETAAKNNLSATVDPVVGDDNTLGYEPGAHLFNVTLDKVFICTDASTGAAVWKEVSSTAPATS